MARRESGRSLICMDADYKVMFVGEDAELWPDLLRATAKNRWRMTFAHGGDEALAALDDENFDGVVTNLRLPGVMDGAEFLHEVRHRRPGVWRFLRADGRQANESRCWMGAAHQLISPPTNASAIEARLTRAFRHEVWRPRAEAQDLLAKCPKLPSPPSMYYRMLDLLASPNASLESVGMMIEQDPVASAKILRIVNSAVFALQLEVNLPSEAVAYLGIETTKALMLLAHTVGDFSATVRVGVRPEQLLRHGVLTARYARWIANLECPRGQTPDHAFTAGLLHDIGKILLAANHGETYAKAIEYARRQNIPLCESELHFFGADHAELGGCLLAGWGLPQPVVEAVALHHNPRWFGESPDFNSVTAVHAANIFATEEHSNDLPSGIKCGTFDEAYLAAGGFVESLNSWRQTCLMRE